MGRSGADDACELCLSADPHAAAGQHPRVDSRNGEHAQHAVLLYLGDYHAYLVKMRHNEQRRRGLGLELARDGAVNAAVDIDADLRAFIAPRSLAEELHDGIGYAAVLKARNALRLDKPVKHFNNVHPNSFLAHGRYFPGNTSFGGTRTNIDRGIISYSAQGRIRLDKKRKK